MTVHLGDLVGPLVDGQLDHDGRDRALGHVAQCPDCQCEVATHRRLKARLLALGGPELPPGAVNRLLGLPASAFADVRALPTQPDPVAYAAIGPTGPSAPPAVISAMNAVLASTAAQLAHLGAAAVSGRAGSVFPGRSRGLFGGPSVLRRDGLLPVVPVRAVPGPDAVGDEPARAPVGERIGVGPAVSAFPVALEIDEATGNPPAVELLVGPSAPVSVPPVGPPVAPSPVAIAPVAVPSADGDRGAWRSEPGWTVRRTVLGSAAALAAVMVGGVALAGGPPSDSTRAPSTTITPVSASFAVSRTAGEVLVVPGRTGMAGSGVLTAVPIVLRGRR